MKFFDFFRKKQGAEPVISDGKEFCSPNIKNPYSAEGQNYLETAVDDEDDFEKDPFDDDPDFPDEDEFDEFDFC